jgi:phosphatidylglycerophosphatase A
LNARKFFLTVGFSGLSPKAPGTVGSFVSLLIGLFLLEFLHVSTLFLLALLITVIAVKQINIYEKETGAHDGKEIVIDELAGMWIIILILIFCCGCGGCGNGCGGCGNGCGGCGCDNGCGGCGC